MAERQRGRDPNRYNKKQEQKNQPPHDTSHDDPLMPHYHRATKFRTEEASEQAYDKVRNLLKETPCDLSSLRTLLLPERTWHLLVFGNTPPEELERRIVEVLQSGRAVELPPDEWKMLNLRRLQQMEEGQEWNERRGPRPKLN